MTKRALFALLVVFPLLAADALPGWIGIGYHYRRTDNRGWMLVEHLDPAGPAAKGGLRARDVITHIDGKPLTVPDQYAMMELLRSVRPAQKLRLTVRRGDRTLPIVVTAAKMTPQQERMWRETLQYERSRARPR
jgi:S1-C subfamily serine protease